MHRVDLPGNLKMSLLGIDAFLIDRDVGDLRETQHRGCFGRDASSKE